jgi:hypothetical protein
LAFVSFPALAVVLASCSGSAGEDEPSRSATLANHDKIVAALGNLSSAVDSLSEAISSFDDENWREVVPKVREESGSVESALSELKGLMTD